MQLNAPWLFLAASLVGAWFTWNAHQPVRARGNLTVPSFFAGWLTTELVEHHLAWQLVATGVFAWAGALSAWPGWLGLAITGASWIGLLRLRTRSGEAEPAIEAGLREGLGAGYREQIAADVGSGMGRPLAPSRRVLPVLLRERGVERIAGIAYAPEHGKRGKLDVYRSRDLPRDARAPVLLQVHGGAWVIGDKREQALPLMLHLAQAGWVCVAANYRLSPRATFPDHLVDLKRAMAWVRANIADYGGDAELVCITGGSAGGHLSSLFALTANDPEYQPGFEEVDTRVAAAVPFYGVYDFTDAHRRQQHDGLPTFLERAVMKTPLDAKRKEWEKASPMHRVHPDAPPFLVVHGTHDSLTAVEEAQKFVELLRDVSREPVCYAEIPGAQHAFEVFHSPRTTAVVRGVERFLGWIVSRERSARAQAPRASGSATTSIST